MRVMQQHAGRIGQAARPASRPCRLEAADLLGDRQQRMVDVVGIGKVGHQRDAADAGNRAQARMGGRKASGMKPRRFMPVFIFEVQVEADAARAQLRRRLFQPGQLLVAMHGRLQIVAGHGVQIGGPKKPSSSRIGFFQPSSRSDGVVDFDQRQAVGLGKTAHRALQPVAVSIRFEHAPGLGAGRFGLASARLCFMESI
jgi:hypothetical protein